MNESEPAGSNRHPFLRRPLFCWPFTLLGMTLALMLFAHRVSAGHGPPGRGAEAWRHHADRILDPLLAEIEASDEQAEKIRTIGRRRPRAGPRPSDRGAPRRQRRLRAP